MLLKKFSFKCHWVLYFFCGIISLAVEGRVQHPAEMHVLGEIRLGGGGVSHLRGVFEQPSIPQKRSPAQSRPRGVLIPTVWRVKFKREELKGRANLLPQHAGMGQVTGKPHPSTGTAQNGLDSACKTSSPGQHELAAKFSLSVLGQHCSFISH